MSDYYLEDRARLQGQPKRTIADYVESQGILVPQRFNSLREARNSGLPIICRSEHPQDYDGVSGLLTSLELSKTYSHDSRTGRKAIFNLQKVGSLEEFKERFFEFTDDITGTPLYQQYCHLLKQDREQFKSQASFSLWEHLGGYNRTVIADSAIKGRYHVMTRKQWKDEEGTRFFWNYTIFEDGKIMQTVGVDFPTELREGLPRLVELYEAVRNLGRFEPNHCPIVEIQTLGGKDYFLQYHRARDFEPTSFNLDAAPERYQKMFFIRGSTPPNGITSKATIVHAHWANGKDYSEWILPEIEDASFDIHYAGIFSELMVRKRKVQFSGSDNPNMKLLEIVLHHFQRSKLFKPAVSILSRYDQFFSSDEFRNLNHKAEKTGNNQYINFHVISDGRNAYVKRV